jgi:NAD(P)H-nitrite reductase large subunit
MKQYVIIGGGVASVGCIEGIRSVDKEGRIVVLSGEGRPVYCRPLISYFLQGKTDPEKMKYRPDEFYAENNCEVVYEKAAAIDPARKTVTLESGESIPYDSLCVATGSSPFVPAFEGLDTVENKYGFMTMDDALALDGAVGPDSDVLIVGAGLIGLKCAEGLCGRAKSITVCDIAPRVLSSILDGDCAALMQKSLEDHGVRFELSDSAERFNINTAYMKSGKVLRFDILVLAVGVRPNDSLVGEAGGVCDRGIRVDTHMRTSLEDVYAAGDCARGYDASTGEDRVLAILPNAVMQGRCAGINMAGGDEVFDKAIPMNAIGFFGLHALTAGSYASELHEVPAGEGVKRLYVNGGLLSGFILIGDAAGAGVYTAMIREKTPVDSVDFGLLRTSPSMAAFSAQYRRKTLGEVV